MHLHFNPKVEKIVELLLYLAHRRPGADKYQAVKFLYLADREHLNKYGRSITQESYWALPYGPVASTAKELIEGKYPSMVELGIEELPFDVVHRGGYDYIENPKRPIDKDIFSRTDLKVFDGIIDRYGDKSFRELFEITHDHRAYQAAWARRKPGAKASRMFYDEMVDNKEKRDSLLHDYIDLAPRLE